MMEFKDYYSTLGVAKAATAKEIKQVAARPVRGGLKTAKAEKLLGYPMISTGQGLSRVWEETKNKL